ncbi:hypothetical protein ACIQUM_02850 [Amycolatopsis azurea]|uniref:hypothetical protein n=1 Tax=Amycolatopsis azurea TaxID=36819 RepID=UPI0037F83337
MTDEKASVAGGVKITGDDSFGKNALDAAKKVPIAGKGVTTVTNAYDKFSAAQGPGDVVAAGGQLVQDGAGFIAGAGADVASFVLDPVGWLVSNGLNILIELIQPLQDALHFVTGDGPALKTAAGNFGNIAKGFVTLADDFVKTGDESLKDWVGDAGDAARNALGDFAVGIKGIGNSAGTVAETLQMWSMVMTVIEEVVKSIISELVTWAIYIWLPALAASVVSFGSSVAAAMTATITKAANAMRKITKHLGALGKLLDKFMGFMAKWTDDLVKQGSKLTKAGKIGMTPGQEKAIVGAFAKGSGTQLGTFGDAAKDVLKGVPNQAIKQVVGVNPADLSKGSAYQGKAGFDFVNKTIDNSRTTITGQEYGDTGGHHSEKETRENLDMDQ